MVEEALRGEFLLSLAILDFVELLCHVLSTFRIVLRSVIPLLLLPDLLEQVGLAWFTRVFVFDHVVMFARLTEERQDEDFIKLGHVRQIWNGILLAFLSLSTESFLLVW